jgi:hypothetical protein
MKPYTSEMAGSGQFGICVKCKKGPTPEGHDGCLGTLPGPIMNACCGHGNDSQAYIQYWGGSDIRGVEAITIMNSLKEDKMPTYEELDKALEDGHKVERCAINQNYQAVNWHEVETIDRAWDVDRYRVCIPSLEER